jgi:hypothetical protein
MPADALPIPHAEQPAPAAPAFDPDPTVAQPIPHEQQAQLREQIRYGAGGRDITVAFGPAVVRSLTATNVTTRSLTSTASNGS